jgi:hypothetical protein
MKKIILLVSAFAFSLAVMAQEHVDSVIKMKQDTYDFGKIKQGTPATTYFEFKNISDKPVVVEVATAGCGCTRPEWDSLPVAPGGTSKIKVGYNAAAAGTFTKDVYVKFAGISEQKTIHITGEVLPADAFEALMKQNVPATAPVNSTQNTQGTKTKTKTKGKGS